MNVTDVWITMTDGVRLAARCTCPTATGPFAALLEALPYRKDDLTASYRDSYVRFADEAGFAVCRLDLRGTGSSGGTATDEYPDVERADLRAVIEWLATQPWSSGRVGMFGTSYSGFNSLHMAAEGVPELGAVVAMYATDDRYTDDVHYYGGVLRGVDLIDYVLYMVPMNALPPVPALWGDGWQDEWRRRIDETPAWLLDWLREQADGADVAARFDPARTRRRRGTSGSRARRCSSPAGPTATATTRSARSSGCRCRGGCSPARGATRTRPARARARTSTPTPRSSPSSTSTSAHGPPSVDAPAQVFVRRSDAARARSRGARRRVARPAGLAAARPALGRATRPHGDGVEPIDELDGARRRRRGGVDLVRRWAAVGPAARPARRRRPVVDVRLADRPSGPRCSATRRVSLRIRSSAPVAHLAVRAVRRVPRRHVGADHPRDAEPHPRRLLAGRPGRRRRPRTVTRDARASGSTSTLELEATTWTLTPGHTLRLAIAGTDWPNCWPPPGPLTLGVDRASIALPRPRRRRARRIDARVRAGRGTVGRRGRRCGVAHRARRARSRDAGRRPATAATTRACTARSIDDVYEGELGVSTVDPGRAWAKGRAAFTIRWPEATCSTVGTVDVAVGRRHDPRRHRASSPPTTASRSPPGSWRESFPRTF